MALDDPHSEPDTTPGDAGVRVVTATCPDRPTAERLAERVVAAGAAACAQVGGPITSVYRWQGEVVRDEEWTVTVKTARSAADRVVDAIVSEHPYDVPEVLVVAVDGGHPPYLDWVRDEVHTPPRPPDGDTG